MQITVYEQNIKSRNNARLSNSAILSPVLGWGARKPQGYRILSLLKWLVILFIVIFGIDFDFLDYCSQTLHILIPALGGGGGASPCILCPRLVSHSAQPNPEVASHRGVYKTSSGPSQEQDWGHNLKGKQHGNVKYE